MPLDISVDEIMEQLVDAAKDEVKATAAIMALLAHVNDYKIPDLINALKDSGVLTESSQKES
ncbi:hypothetical protein BCU98_00370 [Vibrio splendidus]|uniref:hypothetical protein n=1 Tax=Vibrio TaxID=662 RepID=UPI000C829FC0|nr:hypothetical protein [Vibrio splendidus]PMG17819.1 hypothetical protein BCU98_00370 [Vibrio splendidus]